jgi:hypothetical protein
MDGSKLAAPQQGAIPGYSLKSPLHMRVIRFARTFSPRAFLREQPTTVYVVCVALVIAAANWRQHMRMRAIYPDYDKYAKMQGQRYNDAKTQELRDVMRYNDMVGRMREDIKANAAQHQQRG